MLKVIGKYFAMLCVGFVVGALCALLTMKQHAAQQVTQEAREVVSDTAEKVVEAVKEDIRIEAVVDAGKKSADEVKTVVSNDMKPKKEIVYVEVKVPGKAEPQLCPPVQPDSVMPLSVAGVRLLNDLRAYKTVDLTKLNPTESETSANVTVAQFVSTDIDTVALYNELATRHNELVDAVVKFQKEQAADAKASK